MSTEAPPTEVRSTEPSESGPQAKAVAKLADEASDSTTPQDLADATAWFLEGTPEEPAKEHFQLNVTEDSRKPRWIDWSVRAMDRDRIAEIRNAASEAHSENDAKAGMQANLQIAAEATVKPNLKEVRGQFADPADALQARLSFKPGLIDHIAGKVLKATGYDDADVREVVAGKT